MSLLVLSQDTLTKVVFRIHTDVNHNCLFILSQSPQSHRLHVEHHCSEQHKVREETIPSFSGSSTQ